MKLQNEAAIGSIGAWLRKEQEWRRKVCWQFKTDLRYGLKSLDPNDH
jgi:hypothetical protein